MSTILSSGIECFLLLASGIALQLACTPSREASQAPEHLLKARIKRNRGEVLHESRRIFSSSLILLKLSKYIYWMFTILEIATRIFPLIPDRHIAYSFLDVLPMCPHGPRSTVSMMLFYLSIALVLSGSGIRIACLKALGPLFSFSHITFSQHRLVVNGPYAVVRHASYTGLVLKRLGSVTLFLHPDGFAARCGIMSFERACRPSTAAAPSDATSCTIASLGSAVNYSLCAALVFYVNWSFFECFYLIVVRAPKEDESLHKAFGKEWEAYQSRVQFKFIPYII